MGRMVDVDDLVSSSDIARRLGVSPNVVSNYAKRYPDFPRPVKDNPTKIWLWSDVWLWSWLTGKGDPWST